MIHQVLSAICDEVNEFIRQELSLRDDVVVLNNIIDVRGDVNMQVDNKVCLFLMRIEEEKLIKSGGFQGNAGMSPTLFVNLYVVFAANFPDPNYKEALRFISLVLEFFQGKNVFGMGNSPSLPDGIDKVSFELMSLDFNEMNNMWSMLGGRYLPSVVYKVKMLPFNQGMVRDDVPDLIRKQFGGG